MILSMASSPSMISGFRFHREISPISVMNPVVRVRNPAVKANALTNKSQKNILACSVDSIRNRMDHEPAW